jgi:hypothetical protein
MSSRTLLLVVWPVVVVALGIAGYHYGVDRRGSNGADAALAVDGRPAAPGEGLRGTPVAVRVEAVERRMTNLERAHANARALGTTPGTPSPAASVGDAPPVAATYTEDQLVALRAMLDEIDVRKQRERAATAMRTTLRQASKEPLTEDQEENAIAALLAYQAKVAEAARATGPDGAPPTREAREAAASRARAALDDELRRILPPATAEFVVARVARIPGRPVPRPAMDDAK